MDPSERGGRRSRAGALALLGALFAGASSGCVNVYQPLKGLHSPIVIDTQLENFADLRLRVHCIPGEYLEARDSEVLCERVGQLFANQGAEVRIVATKSPLEEDEVLLEAPVEDVAVAAAGAKPKRPVGLRLDLRARRTQRRYSVGMWVISLFTLTLAPGMSEYTFVQEVDVRDERGALLATTELHGRIVRYFGLGYWAGTRITNLLFRDDDEDLSNRNFKKAITNDLYGQLSQIVFNAKLRHQVLTGAVSTSTATRGGS